MGSEHFKNCPYILIVDDDVNTLSALRIVLRDNFSVMTSSSPQEALNLVSSDVNFSVVICDYHMPDMDGISLLSKIRELCPDTQRILFTGQANVSVATDAVNQGQIFRFLTKPCRTRELCEYIKEGVHEFQSRTAERNFGRKTVQALADSLLKTLKLSNSDAYERSVRISCIVERILSHADVADRFDLVLAAKLCHLGSLGVRRELKQLSGSFPTQVLAEYTDSFFLNAADILRHLPQMRPVADLIIECAAGPPFHNNSLKSQILRAALSYDALLHIGRSRKDILDSMADDSFSFKIISAVNKAFINSNECVHMLLKIGQLKCGMLLEENIVTDDGLLLLAKDKVLNECSILRLQEISRHQKIKEPISVLLVS